MNKHALATRRIIKALESKLKDVVTKQDDMLKYGGDEYVKGVRAGVIECLALVAKIIDEETKGEP